MSAVILAAGIGALCGLAIWSAVSLIEQADAEQGPPPTLRPQDAASLPFGLTDGTELYEDAVFAARWDAEVEAHIDEALRLVAPTPVWDRWVCEDIERREWA